MTGCLQEKKEIFLVTRKKHLQYKVGTNLKSNAKSLKCHFGSWPKDHGYIIFILCFYETDLITGNFKNLSPLGTSQKDEKLR